MFKSEKNRGTLYFKCPKRCCDFFEWVDQEPREKTRAWLEEGRFHGVRERYPRSQELFIPQQKDFERKKAEIREREEKRKRRTEEFRERERQHSEEMRNGTTKERERERVYQQEKKNNGGAVTDIMER